MTEQSDSDQTDEEYRPTVDKSEIADVDNLDEMKEYVRELESTVAKQQQTLKKMLPDRREYLKYLGGGAVGAAAGIGLAGEAAAKDDSPNQIGTGSEPQDLVVDQLRDPGTGDVVLDVDDSGAVSASREFSFPALSIDNYATLAATTGDVVASDGTRYDPADYADIGDAVNAAIAANSTVYLPSGTHTYSTDIVADVTNLSLVGQGRAATELSYTGSGAGIDVNDVRNVVIRDCKITGDGTSGQDGLLVRTSGGGTSHCTFQNLAIRGTGRYGIHEDPSNGNIWLCSYQDIQLGGTGNHAFYRESSSYGVAERLLYNVRSNGQSIGGDFVRDIGPGKRRCYHGLAAEPNVSGSGIVIKQDAGHEIRGCKAEGTGGDGFFISTGRMAASGLFATNNSSAGVVFNGCGGSIVHTITSAGNTGDSIRFESPGGNIATHIPQGYVEQNGVVDLQLGQLFGTTSAESPTFDTWTKASDRASLLSVRLKAETDGTTRGLINIAVDESGGTTNDYFHSGAFADPVAGSGFVDQQTVSFYLPPGAQYQIRNVDDPNNANSIVNARALEL